MLPPPPPKPMPIGMKDWLWTTKGTDEMSLNDIPEVKTGMNVNMEVGEYVLFCTFWHPHKRQIREERLPTTLNASVIILNGTGKVIWRMHFPLSLQLSQAEFAERGDLENCLRCLKIRQVKQQSKWEEPRAAQESKRHFATCMFPVSSTIRTLWCGYGALCGGNRGEALDRLGGGRRETTEFLMETDLFQHAPSRTFAAISESWLDHINTNKMLKTLASGKMSTFVKSWSNSSCAIRHCFPPHAL